MKLFGLMALSLPAAQAYTITMYAETGCSGESYAVQDAAHGCKLPAGLPAKFDAQSIRVADTPPTCQVWMFTDAIPECQTFQTNTWRYWTSVSEGTCLPTNEDANGKVLPHEGRWQKPYIFCPT